MIDSPGEYLQATEALHELEEALAALRTRLGPERTLLFQAMAGDYWDSIATIRRDIDAYTGAASAAMARAPLWLGLEGGDLSPVNIRTSLLSSWLERTRKAVAALVSQDLLGSAPRGRPNQDILEACDFQLVGFQPGSLKIGLDVPAARQLELFPRATPPPEVAVQGALERLLAAAAELGEAHRFRHLKDLWPDGPTDAQVLLVKQVLKITPGKRERVKVVTLEGSLVPQSTPVRLDSSLRTALAAILGSVEDPNTVEELEGRLREIDLDKRRFILRERPEDEPPVVVIFGAAQLEDAKRAVDQRVRVEATQTTGFKPHLRALTIEILDETAL